MQGSGRNELLALLVFSTVVATLEDAVFLDRAFFIFFYIFFFPEASVKAVPK
jgi:hypothetical protein